MINDGVGHNHVERQIVEAVLKIELEEYQGAISHACLGLMAIFDVIESQLADGPPPGERDIVKQYKRVLKLLNLESTKKKNDPVRQIMAGMGDIINGVASLSSQPNGAISLHTYLLKHYAILILNTTKTLGTFFLEIQSSANKV